MVRRIYVEKKSALRHEAKGLLNELRTLLGIGTRPMQEMETIISQTVMACETMSRERVGALIVFAREARLEEYFRTGMPLVSRSLTIDGDAVGKPCNVTVPVGTSIREVLEYAECCFEDVRRLIGGGPMMGAGLPSFDMPVTKTNNAVLAFTKDKPAVTTACIRCGRCVNVCPLNLMPTAMEQAYRRRDKAELEALHMNLCMLCGCCSYVCPANRPLVQNNKLAKAFLREEKAKEEAKA